MKREDLKSLELSDEIIDKVMALHGAGIESHKNQLTTAQAEVETLKTQLTEAGTTIEGFKKLDVDAIKAAADDYKAKFEQATAEAQKQILSIKRDHALERDLKEVYKVKDIKSVKAHLDGEKILFDEKTETFTGLKEQVDPLKSSNDYLFADTKEPPKIVIGANSKSVHTDPFEAGFLKGAKLTPNEEGK